MSASDIRIGDYTLNRRLGCLTDRAGAAAHLRPKSYRVLEVLAERAGELVSKDDLAQTVWGNLAVTDESLSQCISDIRRALGKKSARFLRTVPRRGYILETGSTPAETPPRGALVRWAGAAMVLAVVAVLGVATLTGDKAARTGAGAGEVGPATRLAGGPASGDLDWRNRKTNDAIRRQVKEVLAADPQDAQAWAALGLTYWLEVKYSAWGGGRRELDLALDALERSLLLEGGAEPHRVLSEIRLDAPFADARSPVDALAMARAAVELAPEDPKGLAALADALTVNGHAAEAIPVIERASAHYDTPPDRFREIAGLAYLLGGAPAKAVEEFGRLHGAGTFSGTRDYAGWLLAASLAHAGRIEEASSVVREVQRRRPERTVASVALSLDRLADQPGLSLILDGLRLAGMAG